MFASRQLYILLMLLLCIGSCLTLPTTPTLTEESLEQNVTDLVTAKPTKNTTQKNPIKQLVKDIFTLYDAVSDFVKPWFGDSEQTKTETTTIATEPQFDDFDDPGTNSRNESEARRLEELESETFMRYVRSADLNNSPIVELAKYVRNMYLRDAKRRRRRDVMDIGDIFKWVADAFLDQTHTLWSENVPVASRHAKDAWDVNGASLLNEAYQVWEGRESFGTLISNLIRLTRDVTEKTVGKEQVVALERHVRQVQEGRQNLFEGYYDFAINEWSYKFWAVYMLGATALLTYSAIAAIYYGKFNTNAIDYEQYDDLARSNPSSNPLGLVGSLISVNTFQRIMKALSSDKFK